MNQELKALKQQATELLERIAKLEAQPKEKTYSFEECIEWGGFHLKYNGTIADEYPKIDAIKATTEKQCVSERAGRKLSHIIKRLNKDFGGNESLCVVCDGREDDCFFLYSRTRSWAMPYLKSEGAFKKLIETNKPLLKEYFGVE